MRGDGTVIVFSCLVQLHVLLVTGHFSRFRKLVAAGPPFNRKDALEIAAGVSGRGGEGDEGWDMFCWLLTDWLTAHARTLALAADRHAPDLRRRMSRSPVPFAVRMP